MATPSDQVRSTQRLSPERLAQLVSSDTPETGPVKVTQAALLIGEPAAGLAELVVQLSTGRLSIDTAESFLEAVLVSGRSSEYPLILAAVSQDTEQLEAAIRSLRKVNPKSLLMLLCEPHDEPLCRKGMVWGADDYFVLPVASRQLEKVLREVLPPLTKQVEPASDVVGRVGLSRVKEVVDSAAVHDVELAAEQSPQLRAPVARPPVPAAPTEPSQDTHSLPASRLLKPVEAAPQRPVVEVRADEAAAHEESRPGPTLDWALPQLPLVVQTSLINDLLNGRIDFADRAVAVLQSYVKWGGKLRFVPVRVGEESMRPTDVPAADDLHMVETVIQEKVQYGALVVELKAPNPRVSQLLQQAGAWLGGWLAMGRRYEQLRSLAITDELSGAYNRRYFMKFVGGLLERAKLQRFRVSLLMFDIDDFKKYNDEHGHAAGDAIIRELIKLLRSSTRPHDLVARIGGDEFAVVFWDNEAPRQPNSEHPRDAVAACARFRKAVEGHEWSTVCPIRGKVGISGGLATFPWDAENLEGLLAKADEALLRAKRAGKNAIIITPRDGDVGDVSAQ